MASYSILDWALKFTGFRTDSSQGAIEFTVADWTDSLLPSGYKLFEKLALRTYSGLNYTASTGSGDIVDDMIIAHLAAFNADNIFDKVHINPETGQPENRHWDAAKRLILSSYGVFDSKIGEVVFPGQAEENIASTFFGLVDSSVTDWKTLSKGSSTVSSTTLSV